MILPVLPMHVSSLIADVCYKLMTGAHGVLILHVLPMQVSSLIADVCYKLMTGAHGVLILHVLPMHVSSLIADVCYELMTGARGVRYLFTSSIFRAPDWRQSPLNNIHIVNHSYHLSSQQYIYLHRTDTQLPSLYVPVRLSTTLQDIYSLLI